MTKREHSLAQARVAGYHDDKKRFTRLIIESRVNRPAMHEAFQNGKRAKESGIGCGCHECKQKGAQS